MEQVKLNIRCDAKALRRHRKPKNRAELPNLDIQHLLAEPVPTVIESAA